MKPEKNQVRGIVLFLLDWSIERHVIFWIIILLIFCLIYLNKRKERERERVEKNIDEN